MGQTVTVALKNIVRAMPVNEDEVSFRTRRKSDCDAAGSYVVTYTPHVHGTFELSVLINNCHIQDSPFEVVIDNLPNPQQCTVYGPGLKSVEKHKEESTLFHICLADSDNEPCVSPQNVSVTLTMIETREQIPYTVVPESASVYRVTYTPAVAGEMEVSVMVNGVHIKNSPWTAHVENPPDLSRSVVILEGNPPELLRSIVYLQESLYNNIIYLKKERSKIISTDVYLRDSFNDPCVFEQKVSVILERRMASIPRLANDTIYTNTVCKSPSHYQVRFIPAKAGEWMVEAKVNGIPAFGSSLKLTIDNPPSIEHCKVYDVPTEFIKGEMCALKLRLADSDGEDCMFPQHVTASVSVPGSETSVEAKVITLSSHQYQISFIPFKTGSHTVQFQVKNIGEYCHEVSVVNEPDLQHCITSGPGLKSMKMDKSNPVSFLIKLADSDNEPCVSPQNVSVTMTMTETEKQIPVTLGPESASVYHVSYTPAVAGEMEASVMVNGVHINNSPWKVRVDNPPDLCKSKTSFSDIQTFHKSKTETVTADVYLMDSYNEPCVFEQRVSAVIMGRRPLPMTQSTKETICTNIVCKSPSHYQVCFIPDIPGKWMVQVKINGMLAFGSPLEITIKHFPSIEHCKVYDVPTEFIKGEMCALKIRLVDSDGEECVFPQPVTASVSIPGSETSVEAKVITLSSHQYQISFIPFKTGSHTVQFQVENINQHIGEYCHEVSVVNEPDLQHCITSGPGLKSMKMDKSNPVSFLIKLADSDNEPCVSQQNVSVTLTMREIRKRIPVTVVPESASVYHVSYTPAVAGEMEVSVMVNGVHINNSPWKVRVDNPPDLGKSRTSFSGIHTIKKSKSETVTADVHLMDSYNEPCVFEQRVSVVIMRRRPLPMTQSTKETICTDIICKSPSHYQVCFIPDRAGEWTVCNWVILNGIPSFGDSLKLTIDNPPAIDRCKIYDAPEEIVKSQMCTLKLRLADSDGEDCVFPQHVTASVSIPGSEIPVEAKVITLSSHQYQISFTPFKTGSHTVQFQVNDIGKGSYDMFVINLPDPQHCTASGHGLQSVKKHKVNPLSINVSLTDSDNEPCVSPQNVSVKLTMIETREQIPQTVVPESASVYRVTYIPAVAGEMEVSVMVNGVHIKNSPWTVRVDNPPDLSKSVLVGKQWEPQKLSLTSSNLSVWKDKSTVISADIYLVDSYNEPCVFEQNMSTVKMERIMPSMAQAVSYVMHPICKSPSHYQVSFILDNPGEWMVHIEVNGIPAFGSSLKLTIDNPPSIEHCKVYDVPKKIIKGEMCVLKLRLADSDGEDCVTPQHVTASVLTPESETSVEAKVIITLSSHQYEISFTPFKTGSHTVQFQVKHIGEYCHKVSVVNEPDPQHCTASGPGLKLVKKHKYKPVSFLVRLADSDNEPCVSPQNVAVILKMINTRKRIPVTVVPESASVYHVSYTPAVAGKMRVSVWVETFPIKDTPCEVHIDNPPDPKYCVVADLVNVFHDTINSETFKVHLADSDNEPCVIPQNVSVILKMTETGERIPATVKPWSASVYRVSYIPAVAGEMQVSVMVNGDPVRPNKGLPGIC